MSTEQEEQELESAEEYFDRMLLEIAKSGKANIDIDIDIFVND